MNRGGTPATQQRDTTAAKAVREGMAMSDDKTTEQHDMVPCGRLNDHEEHQWYSDEDRWCPGVISVPIEGRTSHPLPEVQMGVMVPQDRCGSTSGANRCILDAGHEEKGEHSHVGMAGDPWPAHVPAPGGTVTPLAPGTPAETEDDMYEYWEEQGYQIDGMNILIHDNWVKMEDLPMVLENYMTTTKHLGMRVKDLTRQVMEAKEGSVHRNAQCQRAFMHNAHDWTHQEAGVEVGSYRCEGKR